MEENAVNNGRVDNELKNVAFLFLILAMTILAVLVIVLNRILDWELWVIPVIVVGIALCWGMYLSNQISSKGQLYLYGMSFLLLVFYYCVKAHAVYDCGTVLVIMILIFAFTRDKVLMGVGIAGALFSLIFHIVVAYTEHRLILTFYTITRTLMVFILVPLSAFLVDRIVKAWESTENSYLRTIDALTDENERVNNFLANVSHEVRTPISAVIGLSYVLQKEELPEQVVTKVNAISDAGHRVAEQISDILDFTEVDMHKIAIRNDNYSISSTINDLLTQLAQSEKKNLDLVVDVDPSMPAVLIGDESKLKRILWHIIRNGYKFTKEGGVYLRLYPIKRDYGINLVIEVKDTGIGMEDDVVENAYEKFYQVDSGRTRTMGGLGLGLAIVNGFVTEMGGVMSIESTPGEGTSVKISLPQRVAENRPYISVSGKEKCIVAGFLGFMTTGHPKVREFYMEMIAHLSSEIALPFYRVQSRAELEKLFATTGITHLFVGTGEYLANKDYINGLAKKINVALVADPSFDEEVDPQIVVIFKPFHGARVASFLSTSASKEDFNEEETISFPGLRALVVDDEHMNLVVAREIFEAYGMVISTASSGEEAIKLCESQEFDIIFMDHMMPGMDGVQAMKRIRENAARLKQEICMVALTANAISTAREMFMSEGFDGFISKPIEVNELERVLKGILPSTFIVYTREKRKDKKKAAAQQPNDAPKDSLTKIQDLGIDTAFGMDYCGGDKDFYFELLLDYADNYEDKINVIKGYLKDDDIRNYEIRVHGVKSTSKLIGAMDLSEKARLLESAAKNGDKNYIDANHGEFITEYEGLMKTVKEILA